MTNKKKFLSPLIGLLSLILIFSQFALVRLASAQEDQLLSEQQAVEALNGPVFLDAYWADRTSSADVTTPLRKEVGPGDGTSTLAVALANRGTSDITAVTGTLTLPDGFSAYGARGAAVATAQASYNQLVPAGGTFTLYFDLNVSDKAKVGSYSANLNVNFNRIRETGSFRNENLTVPYRLTGKVILDPVAITRNLVPGVSNDVQIAVRNSGSAPATGVVVSISGININGGTASSSSTSNDSTGANLLKPQITSFGTNTFSLGTIPPNSNTTLSTSLFPNIATGGNAAGIQLEITYNDANGNSKTLTPSVGVIVLQNAPSIIGVSAGSEENGTGTTATDNRIIAGKADNFILEISNKGTTPITNALVTMQSSSTSLNILGDSKWAVDRIDAHSQARLQTQLFAAASLIGSPATFDVTIDYLLNGSPKTEKYVLGTYVDGEISLRVYGLTINFVGGTPTLVGNLLNEGNTAALFTTIELQQSSGENQSPARTTSNGSSAGIGGNQFGESNTNRNFTRQFSSQPAQPQYLGDVTANSPLPFSMPIAIVRTDQQAETYPVSLKVTYKDSLRNVHELALSGTATFAQQTTTTASSGFNGQTRNQRQEILGLPLVAWIGISIAAAGAIIYFILKRRRTSSKKSKEKIPNNGPEKRDNIEDILKNPQEDNNTSKGKART